MLRTQLIIQMPDVIVGLFTVMVFLMIDVICCTENDLKSKAAVSGLHPKEDYFFYIGFIDVARGVHTLGKSPMNSMFYLIPSIQRSIYSSFGRK